MTVFLKWLVSVRAATDQRYVLSTDCCCFLSSGYEKETVHEKDTVKEIKSGAVIETVLEHALVQRPKQRI